MIFNNKVLLFHFCITFLPALLLGQAPLWLHNSAAVEASHLAIDDSVVTVGGSFQQELDGALAKGSSDIFIYQYNLQQKLLGKYYLGGKRQDRLADLCDNPSGGFYGMGSFSDSLFFGNGDTVLYQNGRSIFVGKWQSNGVLDWAQAWRSTGLVQVLEGVSDSAGALYLTGNFQDTLFLEGWPPFVAPCIEAPFVLKLDAQGQLLWFKTSAACQEATGKALALDEKGSLYWAGEFRGKMSMDSAFNRAHVVYRDLFLLTLDPQTGQQYAQKQFSGVYDNQCEALEYYDQHLYLAGRFRGYLQLDSFLLRTAFKTFGNAYVAQLDSLGTTQWAKQSSAFANAYCTDLQVDEEGVLLVGYYLDSIQWENEKAGSIDKSEAFLVDYSPNGNFVSLSTGQGKGFDVARAIGVDRRGKVWWVGGFQDSIQWEDTVGVAQGFSDAFVLSVNKNRSNLVWISSGDMNPSIDIPEIVLAVVELTPQPAHDSYLITVLEGGDFQHWSLYNKRGRLIKRRTTPIVNTKRLKKGVYRLFIQTSKSFCSEKLLVK